MGSNTYNAEQQAGVAGATDQRQSRSATILSIQCLRKNGERVTMRVRNLSEKGFGGLSTMTAFFEPDEPVQIMFPQMSALPATIKWFAGKEIGVQFDRPVDLKRIAEARKIQSAEATRQNPAAAVDQFWQDVVETPIVSKPSAPPIKTQQSAPVFGPSALNFGKRRSK